MDEEKIVKVRKKNEGDFKFKEEKKEFGFIKKDLWENNLTGPFVAYKDKQFKQKTEDIFYRKELKEIV